MITDQQVLEQGWTLSHKIAYDIGSKKDIPVFQKGNFYLVFKTIKNRQVAVFIPMDITKSITPSYPKWIICENLEFFILLDKAIQEEEAIMEY